MARRELRRYRKRGPNRTTRLLLAGIRETRGGGFAGTRLLDIGGGVGAIQHAFLEDAAAAVTAVDASPAYLSAAREEVERRGTAARVTWHTGDAVELAFALPEAEVVTLDRVLCCYPDLPSLVAVSAERARDVWGVVFPRETWWVRVGVAAVNLWERIRGKAFRVVIHPEPAIRREAEHHGLREAWRARTFLWEVRVFSRE